jgi:hypothetical protein
LDDQGEHAQLLAVDQIERLFRIAERLVVEIAGS